MATEARDVLDILVMFEHAQIQVWIEGGWGVDALMGSQHRDHGDLDLVLDSSDEEAARRLLGSEGWQVIFEDPPGAASFRDQRGRELDLCFTAPDRYGDRWSTNRRFGRGEPDYPSDGFTYGWIGGEKVPCLGPETQVLHHQGYEVEQVDVFDMALLRERFDVSLPDSLREPEPRV